MYYILTFFLLLFINILILINLYQIFDKSKLNKEYWCQSLLMISFKTEVFHHLIIFMLQHMTMPYITLSSHVKTFKLCAIILSKLYSQYSHIIRVSIYCVSKYLLNLFWILVISNSIFFRINAFWWALKSMF